MRKAIVLCSIILLVALAVFLPLRYLRAHDASTRAEAPAPTTSEEEPGSEGRGGDPDAGAVHVGEAQLSTIVSAPSPGWAGESVVGTGNTWEPTVAADPDGKVAAAYREIARKAAAQLSLRARSKSIQFPKIVIQNT